MDDEIIAIIVGITVLVVLIVSIALRGCAPPANWRLVQT